MTTVKNHFEIGVIRLFLSIEDSSNDNGEAELNNIEDDFEITQSVIGPTKCSPFVDGWQWDDNEPLGDIS